MIDKAVNVSLCLFLASRLRYLRILKALLDGKIAGS